MQARGRAVESRDAVWTALVRRGTEGAVALRRWRRQGDRVRPARSGGRRLLVRPALVGVCLAGVLSMGGLILVSGSVSPAASGEPTGRTASAAPSSEASSSGASATAEPAENRDDGEHTGSPESSAALLGDDPAAATVLLLVMRERCLAAASMLCLDGVDQAGSVAMAADSYLVRQVSGGAPTTDGPPGNAVLDQSPFTATVQERRGNAALIILTPTDTGSPRTQPASALVIKGEAGWRLRELFDY